MPKIGEKEFAYTPEGVAKAKQESAETGIPISDGAKRGESYQLGGLIPGQQGFGQRPVVNPLTIGQNPMVKPPLGNVKKPLGMYEEGGEVEYKKGGKVKK